MTVQFREIQSPQNRNLHRAILHNGIVVLAAENTAADIIAARLFMRTGGRYEPLDKAGISHLLCAVLTKGTDRLSSLDIAEQVESVGASLGTDSSTDYCLLSLKTVADDFPAMLDLASQILRSPSFPEAEVDLERRLTLQSIRSMQEQPFAIAQMQLRQAMYQNHPYALPSLGTETTVSQLHRADLVAYHQAHFHPENLIVSIVGKIAPDEAIALVDRIFGDWANANAEPSPISQATAPIQSHPHRVASTQETQQAIVMLGYLTASVKNPDYIPLKLINTYLGNGLSSRLFVELREKQGLAYEVSAYYPTRLDLSQFVVYMGTAPSNAAIALDGLRHEVERLRDIILSPEELQAAKNKLLGQYALGKQTNAQIAQIFGWYETLGLGIEFDQKFQNEITSVTAEEAQSVAHRYFGDPYVSLVGPSEAIAPLVA